MIKRTIFPRLVEHLTTDQMTILIGPRQVGKTYLMDTLRKKLETEGKKTVWLNLDNEEDKERFTSQASLLAYIELVVGKEKGYVFIDEIQRKEDAGLFLKGIFDMHLSHKFIISGSGSLELKAKIPESMAGRKQLFSIDPLSFEEFVNFKTNDQYANRLPEFFAVEEGKANRFFSEYMIFGGYPRVVLAETATLKQGEMQEIYRSYIDRDIHDLLHLDKTDAFTDLLKVIASQIGSLVNMVELSSTISIDQKTIKNYLFYLEQTFIIKKVTPYYRNVRKEIIKAPIYYFVDIGLRNWLLGIFGLAEMPVSLSGHIFENIVFHTLRAQTELSPTQIHFWRTRDHAEVDFVLETGQEMIPVEVKYTKLVKPEIPRSFRNFVAKYKPKTGYIVHLGGFLEEDIDETHIAFVPYRELITNAFGN